MYFCATWDVTCSLLWFLGSPFPTLHPLLAGPAPPRQPGSSPGASSAVPPWRLEGISCPLGLLGLLDTGENHPKHFLHGTVPAG